MKTMTFDDWKAAALAAGNGDPRAVPFQCPKCGHVATGYDFEDVAVDYGRAQSNCIGRFIGALEKPATNTVGCDWAAYGLLGTMGKGVNVLLPDGKTREVFDFAAVAVPS